MKVWQEFTFNELVDFPPSVKLQKGEEYPFIEMDDIEPRRRSVQNHQIRKYENGSCSKFSNNDVLLARITPCLENGKIAQVKIEDKNDGFGSTEFFVFRAKENILDQNFLFYLSKCDLIWKSAVNSMVGASGRQRADASFLKRTKLQVPRLHIQRKIAAVLSAYDDLIENNNRRIDILEKMAAELYREWFVRLRFPGHEKVKIVKGVPEGWAVNRLGDLVEHQIGGGWGQETPAGSENMPVHIIRGTDFKAIDKGDFTTAPVRFEKQSSINSRALKHGDIILENSVNAQSRCTGNTILITEQILKQFDHPVMPASFCKLIRFKDVNLSFYIWKHMRCYYEQGSMEYFQNVATNGIANFQMTRFLERFELKIPTDINLANSFWSYDTSQNKAILQKLKISRDRLLSRLISGKIDVEKMDIRFPESMQEAEVTANA